MVSGRKHFSTICLHTHDEADSGHRTQDSRRPGVPASWWRAPRPPPCLWSLIGLPALPRKLGPLYYSPVLYCGVSNPKL